MVIVFVKDGGWEGLFFPPFNQSQMVVTRRERKKQAASQVSLAQLNENGAPRQPHSLFTNKLLG